MPTTNPIPEGWSSGDVITVIAAFGALMTAIISGIISVINAAKATKAQDAAVKAETQTTANTLRLESQDLKIHDIAMNTPTTGAGLSGSQGVQGVHE